VVGLRGPGAGLARSSPAPYQVCIGAFPNPRRQQARAAPLVQELCFYTMLKTLQAAAALVGYTSEAVRPEISSTFTFNDFENALKVKEDYSRFTPGARPETGPEHALLEKGKPRGSSAFSARC